MKEDLEYECLGAVSGALVKKGEHFEMCSGESIIKICPWEGKDFFDKIKKALPGNAHLTASKFFSDFHFR